MDNTRIEDLRRRIQKDPASIAFAQLAEEYRRAGQFAEAIDVCRTGLALHPGYLSARVTLGRALIELGEDAEAQAELEVVVRGAPENLAAIRGLADIHRRRGALAEALAQYRTALSLALNDPDLEATVNDLTRQLTPQREPEPAADLSFAQIQEELEASYAPPPSKGSPYPDPEEVPDAPPASLPVAAPAPRLVPWPSVAPTPVHTPPAPPLAAQHTRAAEADPDQARAIRTLVVLEQWLAAIHVPRADRHP